MTTTLIVTLLVILVISSAIMAKYFLYKNEKKQQGERPSPEVAPERTAAEMAAARRESAIVEVNLLVRELGVTDEARFEDLIDLCVTLHRKLNEMGDGVDVLMTAPNDFMRLLTKHLPEYVEQCFKLEKPVSTEDSARIDAVLVQLTAQIEGIIKDINDKNYAAFDSKSRFMEIRFSDKY